MIIYALLFGKKFIHTTFLYQFHVQCHTVDISKEGLRVELKLIALSLRLVKHPSKFQLSDITARNINYPATVACIFHIYNTISEIQCGTKLRRSVFPYNY